MFRSFSSLRFSSGRGTSRALSASASTSSSSLLLSPALYMGLGVGLFAANQIALVSNDGFFGLGGLEVTKAIVATKDAPNALGPYSQAVKAGDFLFVSGCIGFDPATNTLVKGGVKVETEQALKNMSAILREGGSDVTQVCKTTVLLNNIKDYKAVNEVRCRVPMFAYITPPSEKLVCVLSSYFSIALCSLWFVMFSFSSICIRRFIGRCTAQYIHDPLLFDASLEIY